MEDENRVEDLENQAEEKREKITERPVGYLPPDFYAKLLNLPACKSKGYCDDCGRCER